MKDLLIFAFFALVIFSGCASTGTQAVDQHSVATVAPLMDTTAVATASSGSTTVPGRWTELKALNPQLANDDYDLEVDSVITMHNGEVYVALAGDNLWNIAEQTLADEMHTVGPAVEVKYAAADSTTFLDEVDVASMTSAEFVEHLRTLRKVNNASLEGSTSEPDETASVRTKDKQVDDDLDEYMDILLANGGRYPEGYFDDTISSTKFTQVAGEPETVPVTEMRQLPMRQTFWLQLPSVAEVRHRADSLSRELRLRGLYGFYDRLVPVANPAFLSFDVTSEPIEKTVDSKSYDIEKTFLYIVLLFLIVGAVLLITRLIKLRRNREQMYNYWPPAELGDGVPNDRPLPRHPVPE